MLKKIAKDVTIAGVIGFVAARLVRLRKEREHKKHHRRRFTFRVVTR